MTRLSANSVRVRPAYSIGEAADDLRVNGMSLQSWAVGGVSDAAAGAQGAKPAGLAGA